MSEPQTNLHYTANGNLVNGQYAPGADGFNLADVSSKSELDSLPTGVKGLVWLGMAGGDTASFEAAVNAYKGDPNLFGFYLTDEPDPASVPAANLKAESDYIHANLPGAKSFIVLQNMGPDSNPVFNYNPANTDIDLYGVDPYPVRPEYTGGMDLSVIGTSVKAAVAQGIPLADIVPVYQAFGGGGYSSWTMPTASQEQQILQAWGSVVPNPAFDVTYSWGQQDGDTALVNSPSLQAVFAAHNAGTSYATGTSAIVSSGGSTTTGSSSGTITPSTGTLTPSTGTLTSSTGTLTPATGTLTSSTGTVTSSTGTLTPSTGTVTPSTGTVTPSTGTLTPSTGTVTPSTGTLTPSTGTVTSSAGTTPSTGSITTSSTTPVLSDTKLTVTDSSGTTVRLSALSAGSKDFQGALSSPVHQSVAGGVDSVTVGADITRMRVSFGSQDEALRFAGPQSLQVTGGSGHDTVVAAAGINNFTAGTGTLDVTGGTGPNHYTYRGGDGLLTVEDFSAAQGDTLRIASSLQSSMHKASDGHGGTLLSFGSAAKGIDLVGVSSVPTSAIHYISG